MSKKGDLETTITLTMLVLVLVVLLMLKGCSPAPTMPSCDIDNAQCQAEWQVYNQYEERLDRRNAERDFAAQCPPRTILVCNNTTVKQCVRRPSRCSCVCAGRGYE